ncbi:haloalkane dehalogenase [Nevskia ramosa]|uniref:haloalkane dehalogenase n=1 Tax=Nevskia ramosa TaxID=64002 RepID=UPI002355E51E|nr:haloalkane dehalogenase [Nevskia ramosa]
MTILRSPDSRFADLPDYPYTPHYQVIGDDGLRMHYVDEGPRDGQVVLLVHGEPTWSYLYRKMIPPLVAAGHRVIAPDLIGFGKSDKFSSIDDYSYQRHVDWLVTFISRLDLRGITLFCQDWGSLLGLRIAAEHEGRFARIVVGNGVLPTADSPAPFAFKLWRAFAVHSPWFPIGRIVATGCKTPLTPAEIAAYDAPFPSDAYKAGARAFPRLVPTEPSDPAVPANRAAWAQLGHWNKPFLCLFGAGDPILGHADKVLIRHIPGAQGQPHQRLRGSHFIQEDQGPALATGINELIRRCPA